MIEEHFIELNKRKILALGKARTFLQGLITNDITLLDNQPIIWTAFLNKKGIYLFDALIVQDPNEDMLYLDVEESLYKPLLQYLQKQVDSHTITFGYTIAKIYTDIIPIDGPGLLVQDPRTKKMGWRLYTTKTLKKENQLSFEKRRIKNGIPKKQDIIKRGFILEYRFLELNGISLKKGCYIGQEVTARMYYKNVKKYQLIPCCWETGNISNTIFTAGKEIGTLTPSKIIDGPITWGLGFFQLEGWRPDDPIATKEKPIKLHTCHSP